MLWKFTPTISAASFILSSSYMLTPSFSASVSSCTDLSMVAFTAKPAPIAAAASFTVLTSPLMASLALANDPLSVSIPSE